MGTLQSLFLLSIPINLILLLLIMPPKMQPLKTRHYYIRTTQGNLPQTQSFEERRNSPKPVLSRDLSISAHEKPTQSPLEGTDTSKPVLTGELYVSGHEKAHPELCPYLGINMRLMMLISSKPSHFEERNAIRMTWRHYAARSDVSSGFVIGYPPNHLKSQIDNEDMLYNDIIVGRFVDSYSNLTLKTLSMLEWVDTYCHHVPVLLKTDDDVFINVPNLLMFTEAHTDATKTIWGMVEKNGLVNLDLKHNISKIQFPQKFPDFTLGPAYLLTTDVIKDILTVAPNKAYLGLEDVFITGILGSALGIKRQHVVGFGNFHGDAFQPCVAKKSIAVHRVTYNDQFEYWRTLFTGKIKCFS